VRSSPPPAKVQLKADNNGDRGQIVGGWSFPRGDESAALNDAKDEGMVGGGEWLRNWAVSRKYSLLSIYCRLVVDACYI
jgi:hypothetical protein